MKCVKMTFAVCFVESCIKMIPNVSESVQIYKFAQGNGASHEVTCRYPIWNREVDEQE